MRRFELTVEVGPIDPEAIECLKSDGFLVFEGQESWRVQKIVHALGNDSIRAQAHAIALETIERYGLTRVSDPPAVVLRNPDAGLDDRPDLLLSDTLRSYDPLPLPRPKRKWFQKPI